LLRDGSIISKCVLDADVVVLVDKTESTTRRGWGLKER